MPGFALANELSQLCEIGGRERFDRLLNFSEAHCLILTAKSITHERAQEARSTEHGARSGERGGKEEGAGVFRERVSECAEAARDSTSKRTEAPAKSRQRREIAGFDLSVDFFE